MSKAPRKGRPFKSGAASLFNPINYRAPKVDEIKRFRARYRAPAKLVIEARKLLGREPVGLSRAEASRAIGKGVRSWEKLEGRQAKNRGMSFCDVVMFCVVALGMDPELFRGGMPKNITAIGYAGYEKRAMRRTPMTKADRAFLRKVRDGKLQVWAKLRNGGNSPYDPLNFGPPSPDDMRALRACVAPFGVSHSEASRVIGFGPRTWSKFESKGSDWRPIGVSEFAAFCILALGVDPKRFAGGLPHCVKGVHYRGLKP